MIFDIIGLSDTPTDNIVLYLVFLPIDSNLVGIGTKNLSADLINMLEFLCAFRLGVVSKPVDTELGTIFAA